MIMLELFGIHDYWLFVATAVVLVLSPGQDTFYIITRSIGQGLRVGIASGFGISTGIVVHCIAAALGLSAVLATSATAFLVLKFAGAGYLVYLGVRILVLKEHASEPMVAASSAGAMPAYRQGVLTNVLNPKVAIFFLAFMPQFVLSDSDAKFMAFVVLGLTIAVMGTAWSMVVAVSAATLRDVFAPGQRAHTVLSRISAGVFILLGLRLAMSRQLVPVSD